MTDIIEPQTVWTELYRTDCREWLAEREPNSIHAVITDPPYGMLEYTPKQLSKMRAGKGGVWRIPPSIGGSKRQPLPRFTVLKQSDTKLLNDFFAEWGELLIRVLVPGAHVLIASSPLLAYILSQAMVSAGFEKRGEIVRLVRTLRGGDRPKGAETEFPEVSAMPRSCWEPWPIFRKPLEGTLANNLRLYGTGGFRRPRSGIPFTDVILSTRTPRGEKRIAPHPSLKPQKFLRALVSAALPLDHGIVLDTFAGSGSTLAASQALGYNSIGLETDETYLEMALSAIPRLAALNVEEDRYEVVGDDSDRNLGQDTLGVPPVSQPRFCESRPLVYDVKLRFVR